MTIARRPDHESHQPYEHVPPAVAPRATATAIWAPLLRDGVRPLFLACDVAACFVAALLTDSSVLLAGVLAVTLVVLFTWEGLYKSRLALSVLDDLPRLARCWLLAVAVVVVAGELFFGNLSGLNLALATGGAVVVGRALGYFAVSTIRRRGWVTHATLVIGADRVGREIAEQVMAHPESGLRLIGFVDSGLYDAAELAAPLLGGPDDVTEIFLRYEPRVLIVARGAMDEDQLVTLVRRCHRYRGEVFVLPRLREVTHVGEDTDLVGDLALVRLRRSAFRSWSWRVKRLLDVAVSGLAIVVLSPVLLACAVAVYLEGGPGIIFRQERVGCDGRRFQLLKFRSLRPIDDTESSTHWNIAKDDRLGPVGRLLRITSLDELPQLFNILRGDMSLVGPRPERPHFVAEFDQLYRGYNARHRVPSGLTGWAQIHGLRGDTSIADRARFDNFYIENWSLWLDVKILIRTAVAVIRSPGS